MVSSKNVPKLAMTHLLSFLAGMAFASMLSSMTTLMVFPYDEAESASDRWDNQAHSVPDRPDDQTDSVPDRPDSILQSFTEILIASGSDKYEKHHYERYYEPWLAPYRNKAGVKLLEIGAQDGKSLKLWSDYLTKPQMIMGLAYGDQSGGVEERLAGLPAVSVFRGDQSKPKTMEYLQNKGPWDIIIDDGSHFPAHMVYSFFSLWKSIKPGGIFIIEDLETNYWKSGSEIYGYQLNGTGIEAGPDANAVVKFMQFVHVINKRQIGARNLSIMPGDEEICSIEFGMNLVAFKKCSIEDKKAEPDMQPALHDREQTKRWIAESKKTNPK
jgi:hypothetical protein